jgi:hypothetical protein
LAAATASFLRALASNGGYEALDNDTKHLGEIFRGEATITDDSSGAEAQMQVLIDGEPVVWDTTVDGKTWPIDRQLMSALRAVRTELEHADKPRKASALARIEVLAPSVRELLAWVRSAWDVHVAAPPSLFRIRTAPLPAARHDFVAALQPTYAADFERPASARATNQQRSGQAAPQKRSGAASTAADQPKRPKRNDPLAPLFAGGGARSSVRDAAFPYRYPSSLLPVGAVVFG